MWWPRCFSWRETFSRLMDFESFQKPNNCTKHFAYSEISIRIKPFYVHSKSGSRGKYAVWKIFQTALPFRPQNILHCLDLQYINSCLGAHKVTANTALLLETLEWIQKMRVKQFSRFSFRAIFSPKSFGKSPWNVFGSGPELTNCKQWISIYDSVGTKYPVPINSLKWYISQVLCLGGLCIV